MARLEGFLKLIEMMIQEYEKSYLENKRQLAQRVETFDNIFDSRGSSNELKAIAMIAKRGEHTDSARLSGTISILRVIQLLALNMRMLELSVNAIKTQLAESGILEKAKDIEDIKRLKALVKSKLESLEKAEKTRKENTSYIE